MMRVTRIDVAAETGSRAAFTRDGDVVTATFYRPGEPEPFRPGAAHTARIDDGQALWDLAAKVQRGLEFTNGAPGRVEAYLVVIETLLEGD
jgi:hypothetical protein